MYRIELEWSALGRVLLLGEVDAIMRRTGLEASLSGSVHVCLFLRLQNLIGLFMNFTIRTFPEVSKTFSRLGVLFYPSTSYIL